MSKDKKQLFLDAWNDYGDFEVEWTPEHKFHPTRKWRMDWADKRSKVCVEVEGNAWSVRGGGRHMRQSDMDKYNQAALHGWTVLRVTPQALKKEGPEFVCLVMAVIRRKSKGE